MKLVIYEVVIRSHGAWMKFGEIEGRVPNESLYEHPEGTEGVVYNKQLYFIRQKPYVLTYTDEQLKTLNDNPFIVGKVIELTTKGQFEFRDETVEDLYNETKK